MNKASHWHRRCDLLRGCENQAIIFEAKRQFESDVFKVVAGDQTSVSLIYGCGKQRTGQDFQKGVVGAF